MFVVWENATQGKVRLVDERLNDPEADNLEDADVIVGAQGPTEYRLHRHRKWFRFPVGSIPIGEWQEVDGQTIAVIDIEQPMHIAALANGLTEIRMKQYKQWGWTLQPG
jgi:hypothetical protein